MRKSETTIIGAGIAGVWQALTLARRGHSVRLLERSGSLFDRAASGVAGAMLAPFCEAESSPPEITGWGLRGLSLWRERYPGLIANGSLVVAASRDRAELRRFAAMTRSHRTLDAPAIAALEPALESRFEAGLFYPDEAHVEPRKALEFLLRSAIEAGATVEAGREAPRDMAADAGWLIDCRGYGAAGDLPQLRGVRGEMLVLQSDEISLSRPVRLLHPRFPVYVVPWDGGRFMVGATMIESADAGPVTARSALDLLGAAYALHPAFGEARILSFASAIRPAFADNLPRIMANGRHVHANGLYRHGYLLAPILAEETARFIDGGPADPRLLRPA